MGRLINSLDAFQQRHRAIAFPIAVWRKFSDDQAGNLAALVAYYAFLSTFPLLLVLVTVLGMVLSGNPHLQQDVLNSALSEFPVIGQQLRSNVHSLGRSGIGLVIGLVFTLIGARGVANAMQNAMNEVWEVPRRERPGFPGSWLRSFALIAIIGLGVIVTTVLSGVGSWSGHTFLGAWGKVIGIALSLLLNIGLFWLGLRVATTARVTWRQLRVGAILSAVVWQILQYIGGYVVAHTLRHASATYGTFGLVLGLLAWFHLQAQLTLYAVEADVVRARKMWPRSLFPPPLTREDREAMRSYAQVEERRPEVRVETHFHEPDEAPTAKDA
ncbi:YihY/virulence factor BrkB family protein [Actinospica sp. MGRD01-02]|uniref:YihY/virulence factor BrkB family protein n=1 Tax=Actinospica acidithermotolerans TaxID=2828514 RepID=A0A941EI23_9ACTN|nr:YihY/virulence factor BrkB family protein [Actinospica acidithermotolerans]MBR7828034.1 YihY/virulence factor BrkB family protein [Actinospica acidithermotolerans]